MQRRFLRTPGISLHTSVVGGLLGGACFMLTLWSPKLLGTGGSGCATRNSCTRGLSCWSQHACRSGQCCVAPAAPLTAVSPALLPSLHVCIAAQQLCRYAYLLFCPWRTAALCFVGCVAFMLCASCTQTPYLWCFSTEADRALACPGMPSCWR